MAYFQIVGIGFFHRVFGGKMRKLRFHEKKLLKKVNFLEWKREGGHREAHVMHRYHVTGRDDYKK